MMRVRLEPALSLIYTSVPKLANGSQTKCAHVWMGLQTCATLSANGSHIVRYEPKFVGFLRDHKKNRMRRVSFLRTVCPSLTSGSQKINYPCAKYVLRRVYIGTRTRMRHAKTMRTFMWVNL